MSFASSANERVVVIGGGITGLGAAWALSKRHAVTLLEKQGRFGGHANTVEIESAAGVLPVDTGFIVYNEVNYPNLVRLFSHLGVATEDSDMSFAVSLNGGRNEYSGSLLGLVGSANNLFRRNHWRMLSDLLRFYRWAAGLRPRDLPPEVTLGALLSDGGFSESFQEEHILPMGAAIWSCSKEQMLAFPAASFIEFFINHGLFNLGARPQWRTVTGGSQAYVRRVLEDFDGELRSGVTIKKLARDPQGVAVHFSNGSVERFDQAVLACHADEALDLLGEGASYDERSILGTFGYQDNRAVLHRDPALMPQRRRLWSSWNYISDDAPSGSVETASSALGSVSYWMNRLQNIAEETPVIVSLNPPREPVANSVFAEFDYRHPLFDLAAIKAQGKLPMIQGVQRTWYCGAYCGYGFHEDGLQAGLSVAAALGAAAPWHDEIEPRSPATQAVRRIETLMAAE